MDLFDKFSSKENLKKAYHYVQNELLHSTLSVNPFNHPAITAIADIGDEFFSALEKYLRAGKYKPEKGFFVYIQKDSLGLRPVCILSLIDRIVYQALFNQDILGLKIDAQLSDDVCFANRVEESQDENSFLSLYFGGWDEFCKVQKITFENGYIWKLELDVQQYYERIPINRLIGKLKTEFGIKDEKLLSLLESQLCTWTEYEELAEGIPQGPSVSALLSNAYLSSLDTFVKNGLSNKNDIKYFRYADDIVLMGKSKESVMRAVEQIVHYLRAQNLTLNEKTKLYELQNTEKIEEMRLMAEYGDDSQQIPPDEFTRIQGKIPKIITAILNREKVEKIDFSNLKYFLKVSSSYNLSQIKNLIEILPLRPSLTIPIIQYVSEARAAFSQYTTAMAHTIDGAIWNAYKSEESSEWSKFWLFKLLLSNLNVSVDELADEVDTIISSSGNSIFKIICFYYRAIHKQKINLDEVQKAVEGCKTNVEKSLYSFFLLNAFKEVRLPVIKEIVEKLLHEPSHELNLIGSYIYKNKSKIKIENYDGNFSNFLLKRTGRHKESPKLKTDEVIDGAYFLVRQDNLIPVASPPAIFGVSRVRRKKHTVELTFPEPVQWEKVEMKFKEGKQDVEIWYEKKHIITADYIELGFSATKKEYRPNRSWEFLKILSTLSATDIKTATTSTFRQMMAKQTKRTTSTSNVHQTKKYLSFALRGLFKTDDDPFYPRKEYYEPKFKILPEPILRYKELWKQGGQFEENIHEEPLEDE